MKNENIIFHKTSQSLRRRTDLNPTQKLIIGYLLSFQENIKVCHQTAEELSFELGIPLSTMKRTLANMEKVGLIKRGSFKELGLEKNQYKNRKATMYVEGEVKPKEINITEAVQPEEIINEDLLPWDEGYVKTTTYTPPTRLMHSDGFQTNDTAVLSCTINSNISNTEIDDRILNLPMNPNTIGTIKKHLINVGEMDKGKEYSLTETINILGNLKAIMN